MPETITDQSQKQMVLRAKPEFLARLEYIMVQVANSVLSEAPNAAYNFKRVEYANRVLNNPTSEAGRASTIVAGGVNITAKTFYDEPNNTYYTTATDAEFLSQVATLWNALSGISVPA